MQQHKCSINHAPRSNWLIYNNGAFRRAAGLGADYACPKRSLTGLYLSKGQDSRTHQGTEKLVLIPHSISVVRSNHHLRLIRGPYIEWRFP